jgi:hypothetical protein
MNKRNVNLLHTVPKKEVLNSKNLHVVTRSGAGQDNYQESSARQMGYRNTYPDPEQEEKLMREVLEIFQKYRPGKKNGSRGRKQNTSDTALDEFL